MNGTQKLVSMGQCSRCKKEHPDLQLIQDSCDTIVFYGNLCPDCFLLWGRIWDKKVAPFNAKEIKYREAWDKEWKNFMSILDFEKVC